MREILFRGKRLDDGEWVYGSYVEQYGAKEIYLPDGVDRECGLDHYHILPESLGQYTELKDKNGTKIFEGDIVKLSYKDGFEIGPIGWSTIDVRYKFASPDGTAYGIDVTNTFEVIGNIHDNPELMKGGED